MVLNNYKGNGMPNSQTSLLGNGLHNLPLICSLFVRKDGGDFTTILICMDVITMAKNNNHLIYELKKVMKKELKIKDVEKIKYSFVD